MAKEDPPIELITEVDEPAEFSSVLKTSMPTTKTEPIDKSWLSFFSHKRAIRLVYVSLGILGLSGVIQVVLSACTVNFESAYLSGLIETCKVIISAALGYLFGSKSASD